MKAKKIALTNAQMLEQCINPDVIKQAVDALVNGLTAKTRYFDKKLKAMVEMDDDKTRVASALGLMAYGVGKPVERKELVIHRPKSLAELRAMASASPELRASIQALMDGDEKPSLDV